MQLLIIILAFLCAVILVVALGTHLFGRREIVRERLSGIRKMSVETDPEDMLSLPFMQRVVTPALSSLGHFLGNMAPNEIRQKMEKRISYAGRPWNATYQSVLAVQALLGGILFATSLFLVRTMQVGGGLAVIMVLLLTLVGLFLPSGVINSRGEARQKAIRRALPDMLDLLLVSVEAGLGFDMALKRVTQQMPGPLSAEIKRALHEIRMGGTREDALRGMAKRTGVSDLSSFISAVVQAEQLGSNIAGTLRVQSDYMRMKRRQLAEEMAMKAPVKLIFPLLLFIFPSLFVVILGPAAIRIFQMFSTMF